MNKTSYEDIIKKTEIVDVVSEYVQLTKKGRSLFGLCPFHADKHPSMSVSSEKQLFNCFSCGTKGSVATFITLIDKIPFHKSISKLANRLGEKYEYNDHQKKMEYSANQLKIFEINKLINSFFVYQINETLDPQILNFIKKRNLNTNIINHFSLGYAPISGIEEFLEKKQVDKADAINASILTENSKSFFINRLIFPIKDSINNIIGFSGRVIQESDKYAKYINTKENIVFNKSSILYNIENALDKALMQKELIIVEGFMDVIAFQKIGIENVVAIMGTTLTRKHLLNIKGLKLKLFFDNDKAGNEATIKSLNILIKNKFKTEIVQNNLQKDPDEIITLHGKDKMIEILKNTITDIDFMYNVLKKKYNLKNSKELEKFTNEFSYLLALQDDFIIKYYLKKSSEELKIPKSFFSEKLKKMKIKKSGNQITKSYDSFSKSSNSFEENHIYQNLMRMQKYIIEKIIVSFIQNNQLLITKFIPHLRTNLEHITFKNINQKNIINEILIMFYKDKNVMLSKFSETSKKYIRSLFKTKKDITKIKDYPKNLEDFVDLLSRCVEKNNY